MRPSLFLGVPLMDADHALIETLFEAALAAPDAALADHFRVLETEVADHFAREEAAIAAAAVPVIECHRIRHRALLAEFAVAHPAGDVDPPATRAALSRLAGLILDHVASVDRVTAGFLAAALPSGRSSVASATV